MMRPLSRVGLRAGVSILVLGAASLSGTALHAQEASDPASPTAEDSGPDAQQNVPPKSGASPAAGAASADEEIVITGLRASIASAQSIKINADQFVDSVTAIDIGALPDKNVAEALQRIPGIQITRNRGEGSSIAIRGLTQVRTEVNGRDSFGASGGRSLGFEDVPSELLAGVDVYKNPSAELIEGAIGGLVNLRTRMPFDQKGLLLAATVGANHYDLIDKTEFNGSVLASNEWETGIGRIGVLVDLSYFKGSFRSDELVVEPYVDADFIPGHVGETMSVPDGAGVGVTFGERRRKGAYAAVQWAPTDALEFYGQVFHTNYYIETPNLTSFVTRGTDAAGVSGLTPLDGFQFDDDGTFISGGFSGLGATANNSQVSFNRSKTTDYAVGFHWQAADRLRLNVDLQYIDSTATNRSYTAFAQRDGGSFFLDLSEDLPEITIGPDGADDPANYYLIALMDHKEDSNADQYTARADLEWDFDEGGFLRSFTAGARYTDRSAINRSTPYNWTFLSAPWQGNAIGLSNYAAEMPFENFYGGDRVDAFGGRPFFDYNQLWDADQTFQDLSTAANNGPRPIIDFTPNDINIQDEQTYGGYAMLRFKSGEGDSYLDGNLGVRVVRTENSASGNARLTYRTSADPTTNITVDTPQEFKQSYTSVLPSLNLRYRANDQLQFRAAASKGLSRPPFYDMRAVFNISENYASQTPGGTPTLVDRTGNGGNPRLKPLTVDQADVAVEWFPKSSTLVYGTLFYKRLKNFLTTVVYDEDFEVPGSGLQTFRITALANGSKGTAKGFEVGVNTFFDFLPRPFDGLGMQANLTYVDSSAPGAVGTLPNGTQVPTTLQGLSKWSYNLVGMYEKKGLRARVAYNWRDDYLETISGNGTGATPIYREAYGQLDGSIGYDFNRHFGITLDAVNILRQDKRSYQNVPQHPRFYQLEDRRIGISLRFRN